MLQLMHEGCSCTYPPLSIARYSFIQLSELVQCRVKKLVQGFNTAAQDSNPGSRSRESEALPLSHCALHCNKIIINNDSTVISCIYLGVCRCICQCVYFYSRDFYLCLFPALSNIPFADQFVCNMVTMVI